MRELAITTAQVVIAAGVLASACGLRVDRRLAWGLGAGGVVVFGVVLAADYPGTPEAVDRTDFAMFWGCGQMAARGEDPYQDPRFLNPPPFLALARLLAAAPRPVSFAAYLVVNAALYLVVPYLAFRLVDRDPTTRAVRLPLVTALLALSLVCRIGVLDGQSVAATLAAVMTGLLARRAGRPWLAGVCFGVATIKPQISLPFFLLLQTRSDWKTWAAAVATGVAMGSLAGGPGAIPDHVAASLRNIARMGTGGRENDITYANPLSNDHIALDFLFYRAGLKDADLCRVVQYAVLAVLGAWVVRRAYLRGAEPDVVVTAAWYSALFLHHHIPDLAVLLLPLVYSSGRAAAAAAARAFHLLSVVAVIGALNVWVGSVRSFTERVLDGQYDPVTSRLIELVVLPHGTWLVVLGMAAFVLAVRLDRSPPGGPARAGRAAGP